MKSYKLKDAGKDAFPVGPVAASVGFGAIDDDGRVFEVRVQDIALQRLDPSSGGANHTSVLEIHRSKMFRIAAEKYERGRIEPGNPIILVTDADVAQQLG